MNKESVIKSKEGAFKDLGKRAIVAFILIPMVFIAIYFLPPLPFLFILQIVIILALMEFYSLSEKRGYYPLKTFGIIFSLLLGLNFLFEFKFFAEFLFLSIFAIGSYFLFSTNSRNLDNFVPSISITLFGILYLSFTLNYIFYLKKLGSSYLFVLLFSVYIGDTGAYIFGKTLGREKIFPVASPNKTVQGFIGAIPFYILGGLLGNLLFLKYKYTGKLILTFFILSFVSQISDPIESLFKRSAGVKDSSRILGEHGGILDRVDSLIFSSPLFYFIYKYYLI